VRRRWVRSYLRCYLILLEDDRCGVLENTPLLRHFTKREEELFKIGVVSFEHIATLLRQGFESRLDDVVLVEVGSVGARVSTLNA
jgi:hypothetical protein